MVVTFVRCSENDARQTYYHYYYDHNNNNYYAIFTALHGMQTRSGDKNSVSVYQTNACIVTKRKKDLSRFLYRTKDRLA